MTTSTSARLSSMCNGGAHKRCAAAQARCDCACHGPRGQQPPDPKEPAVPVEAKSFRLLPQASSKITSAPPIPTTPARPGDAVKVELRRCDPHLGPARWSSLQHDIAEALVGVRAEPGVWFQVATWPGKSSASGQRKKLSALHPDIELRSMTVGGGGGGGGGSTLYARARP